MKYLFEKDIFITNNLILGKNSCFLKVIQFFKEKVVFEIKLKVFMKNKSFLEIIFFRQMDILQIQNLFIQT